MTAPRESNLATVRGALAALSAADYPLYLSYMTANVRFHVVGASAEQDVIGRSALWTNVLSLSTATIGDDGFREEILHTIVDFDWVVVESRGYETTVSGDSYNNEYLCFYRVERGQIAEIRYYLDTHLTRRIKKL